MFLDCVRILNYVQIISVCDLKNKTDRKVSGMVITKLGVISYSIFSNSNFKKQSMNWKTTNIFAYFICNYFNEIQALTPSRRAYFAEFLTLCQLES